MLDHLGCRVEHRGASNEHDDEHAVTEPYEPMDRRREAEVTTDQIIEGRRQARTLLKGSHRGGTGPLGGFFCESHAFSL